MDLVQIRKKAKSRKTKSSGGKEEKREKRTVKGPEEAPAPPAPEAQPAVAAKKELQGEPQPVEETGGSMTRGKKGGSRRSPDSTDSLQSLRDVLMSQHDERKEEEEEEQLQLLTFMLSGEEYALNIMDIKEIIRPKEATEVPRTPEYILGILSLRGTIIPIFDVNIRLGLKGGERGSQNRIVVVKWREHLYGLLVDSVVQVLDIPIGMIEPPPEILGGVEGDFLRGVGKMDDRLIILLNLGRILDVEEEEASGSLELPAGT